MKKKESNISAILLLVAGVLIIGALLIWAPTCAAMVCVPTGHTAILFALIAIALGVQELIFKNNKSYIVILALGILIIAITYKHGLSNGFCPNPMMRCHKSDWWIKAGGLLTIVSGVLSAINSHKRKRPL